MKDLHWFPFYVDDWKNDEKVRLMGPLARAYYFHLLCHQWLEGSIPADREAVAALVTMPQDPVENPAQGSLLDVPTQSVDFDAILDQVLRCFRSAGNGRLINPKLARIKAEQRIKAEEKKLSASAAGRIGGSARSETKSKAARENGKRGGRPKKTEPETQPKTHQNPRTPSSLNASVSQIVENAEEKPKEIQIQIQNKNTHLGVGFSIDEWVPKIAAANPELDYLKGRPLTQPKEYAIAEAIVRDGPEVVLAGTRRLRDVPQENRRYIADPVKFYRESKYLPDAPDWDRLLKKSSSVTTPIPVSASEQNRAAYAELRAGASR